MSLSLLSEGGGDFPTFQDSMEGIKYPDIHWSISGCLDQYQMIQALPPMPRTGLTNMPVELIRRVCGYLEPIWLWNLSHVCALTYGMLSFERGNHLWYQALPSSLWTEAEQFQEETELYNYARDRHLNVKLVPYSTALRCARGSSIISMEHAYALVPASKSYVAHYVQVIPGYTYHYYPATSMTPARVIPISGPSHSPGYSRKDLAPGIVSAHAPIAAIRHRLQALGVAYESIFNYKREIVAHLMQGKRCFVCLSGKTSHDEPSLVKQWGIRWCSLCLRNYTTSPEDLRHFQPMALISATAKQACIANRRGKPLYYLPEIDALLRHRTGLDMNAHKISLSFYADRRENSCVINSVSEKNFREIRLKIVMFAKMLWEGQDPDPDMVMEEGRMVYKARPNLATVEKYRVFRDRFAPTADLAKYLFHERLLAAHPENIPCSAPKSWLHDPTKNLPSYYTVNDVGNRWVSDAAHIMLEQLTAVWERDYDKKFGGRVDTWSEAATAYQIRRLEEEIRSGAVVQLSFVPKELRHSELYSHIRKLRMKTGLQELDHYDTAPLPKHTSDFSSSGNYSVEEYRSRNRAFVSAQNERRDKIKYFNKIIRETCNRCPRTNLVFAPKGIEGLVDHIRKQHQRAFWETDDFHVIG